jgi:NAD+ diphosphatase
MYTFRRWKKTAMTALGLTLGAILASLKAMPFADQLFTYCPRCGAHSLSRERAGVLSCSACGLQFFLNVASAAAAVIRDSRGRVLFVRRSQDPGKGLLDLPGGFVDPGESAEQALRREMREEMGLEIGALSLIGTEPNEYEYRGITYRTLDLFYHCGVADPAAARPLEEIQEILFLDPAAVAPREMAFASARAMLGRIAS